MRYNTKFAFLSVAIFCATTFALPLHRNAGSIVARSREVNNDISAREFYDMYLKARAGDDGHKPKSTDNSDPNLVEARTHEVGSRIVNHGIYNFFHPHHKKSPTFIE